MLVLLSTVLVAAAPVAVQGFSERANAAAARDDWLAVAEVCGEWERAAPGEAFPSLCLAQAYKTIGRYESAVDAARRSLAVQDGPVARFYLGVALYELGRLDAAASELERSVALEPDDPNARRMAGIARAALGEYRKAAEHAEVSRRRSPSALADERVAVWTASAAWTFPRAALRLHGLGGWQQDHGRIADAAKTYREALAIAPEFADCHFQLGAALHQLGDSPGAERELRRAIETFGPSELELRAHAKAMLAMTVMPSRAAEAVALLEAAIATAGEHARYLEVLARACTLMGDRTCAVDALRRFVRTIEPGFEERQDAARRQLEALTAESPSR